MKILASLGILFITGGLIVSALPFSALAQETPPVVPQAFIQFSKLARNVTRQPTAFLSSIEAQGADTLEFQILVRNAGNTPANIQVRDELPAELFYTAGSTTVNGVAVPDGIVASGIALGNLSPGEEKIVKFQAIVFFGVPQKTITNRAIITANNQTQAGSATIRLAAPAPVKDGPGKIITGPANTLPWVLAFGFAGSLGAYWLLFRFRFQGKSIFALWSRHRLNQTVKKLREKERIPDTDFIS